jgi:hypothetical protein
MFMKAAGFQYQGSTSKTQPESNKTLQAKRGGRSSAASRFTLLVQRAWALDVPATNSARKHTDAEFALASLMARCTLAPSSDSDAATPSSPTPWKEKTRSSPTRWVNLPEQRWVNLLERHSPRAGFDCQLDHKG